MPRNIGERVRLIQATKPPQSDLLNGEHRACRCDVCLGRRMPKNPDRGPGR